MAQEVWLRGPVEGYVPELMPVAHSLLQAREDLERELSDLSPDELWTRPGGAASLGFHAKHLAGSIDRLMTYAMGEGLSSEQFAWLRSEGDPGTPPADGAEVLEVAIREIDRALGTLRSIPAESLLEERFIGRARLRSNALGILYHIGEHTTRHVGQIITTKKIVRGLQLQ